METSFQYVSRIQKMMGLIFQPLKASWRFVHCSVPSIQDNAGGQKILKNDLANGWVELVSPRSHSWRVLAAAYMKYIHTSRCKNLICFDILLNVLSISSCWPLRKNRLNFSCTVKTHKLLSHHSLCQWWKVSREWKHKIISNVGSKVAFSKQIGWCHWRRQHLRVLTCTRWWTFYTLM